MTDVIVQPPDNVITVQVDLATEGSIAAAALATSEANRAASEADRAQTVADVAVPEAAVEAVDAVLQDSDRMQGYAAVAASKVVIPSLPGGRNTDGTRNVPILLTSSLSPVTVNDVTAQHQRHPFRVAADVRRARVRIRNYNLFSEVSQTGAISFTGVYFGAASTTSAGNLTGNITGTPVQVLGAFSTPSDGSEYVSDWFDLNYAAYAEGMFSFGWTAASGQVIQRSRALTWVSATPGDAAVANPTMTLTQTAYFDIVIEVEVSATVPVVGYWGDSLTVGFSGGGSNQPQIIRDSWANQHALQHGHLAMLYAYSGSKLDDWASTSAWKWTRWSTMTKPDAGIIALGSNDVFDSTAPADLATTQARFQTMVVNVRALTKQVYATTVLPRNGSDSGKEAVRAAYNDWLRGCPQYVMNTWDVAEALQDPANIANLRAPFVGADNAHLTRGGNRRQATAVGAPLVRVALSLPALQTVQTPLLDTYTGAFSAYSMRQLRSGYGGACVRLRRSSDNAEADFGFILYYLNRAAIQVWAGSSDAFLVTWYDQSGNGRNMTQATASAQPRILTAGAFTTGSKVAPRFDGTDDYLLNGSAGLWAAGAASILAVVSGAAQQSKGLISEGNSATAQGQYSLLTGDSTDATRAKTNTQTQSGAALGTANAGGVFDGTLHQVGWIDTGTVNTVRKDEGAGTGVSYSRSGATLTPDRTAIGAIPRSTLSGFYAGDAYELLTWGSALDATTRAAVSLNQKAFYGTP